MTRETVVLLTPAASATALMLGATVERKPVGAIGL
jgi:hypothetical protein